MESTHGPGSRPFLLVVLAAVLSCLSFTPTNRAGAESVFSNDEAGVTVLNSNTVRCPLRQGETIFIVSSQGETMLDRLIVVNDNGARGELNIAVSNHKLPAASERWKPVEGSIQFSHKRVLNVSLVGVEAKYAKLVFHIGDKKSATITRVWPVPALTSTIPFSSLHD